MSKGSCTVSGRVVEYAIEKKSGMRSIRLKISPQGEIFVVGPYTLTHEIVHTLLKQKSQWIEKVLTRIQERRVVVLNEPYQIAKTRLRVFLEERVGYYCELYGVVKKRIIIKKYKGRWGSCSAQGNLCFNVMLATLPREMQEYVIVHEVCHRIEFNHSPRFWKLVEKAIPEYKVVRKEMKKLLV